MYLIQNKKRKIIGNEFVYVFDDEAKVKDVKFSHKERFILTLSNLVQDTAQTIKSHHNVDGLPEDMQFGAD